MWTKKINVKKVTPRGSQKKFDQLLIEKKTKLVIETKTVSTFFHTQVNEKEMINGFCIANYQSIPESLSHTTETENETTITITKTKPFKATKINITHRLHDTIVFNLTALFQEKAILFKDTAISESAGFATTDKIISFSEDINSFNAFYKALGLLSESQLKEINKYILLISFKIDDPLITLCKQVGIKTIISRTGITARAYESALETNIKLLGFARGTKYSIFN